MRIGELNQIAYELARLQDMPVTAKKLSEMTGFTVSAIYHMAEREEIPCIKKGRTLLFSPLEVSQTLRNENNQI